MDKPSKFQESKCCVSYAAFCVLMMHNIRFQKILNTENYCKGDNIVLLKKFKIIPYHKITEINQCIYVLLVYDKDF